MPDPAAARAAHGDYETRCVRCAGVLSRPDRMHADQFCGALALAALICYPIGVLLPVMRLEQLGHVHEASIWSGSISLLAHGQWLIGIVVLACSIVIPILKLAGIFFLTLRPAWLERHHQAWMYRWIERMGRWGMIDVLLVAVLIAAVKLGDLVVVTPGPGVVAFGACVVLSVLATACFNPHAIWEQEAEPGSWEQGD